MSRVNQFQEGHGPLKESWTPPTRKRPKPRVKKRLTKIAAQKQIAEARTALAEYEAEETRAANASLIGKCFRYRNCYSCPQDESDYWWLYIAVTGMSEHGHLHATEFQTDKDGQTTVKPNRFLLGDVCRSGKYLEITRTAWLQARDEMLARVRLDSQIETGRTS